MVKTLFKSVLACCNSWIYWLFFAYTQYNLDQGCPNVFQFGPNFILSKVVWPQKAVHAESCSDFLIFLLKFRCSQKKNIYISSLIFSLQFFNFSPKLQVFSKKKVFTYFLLQFLDFCPKIQVLAKKKVFSYNLALISRFPPQMSFSNLARHFFVTFVIARKLNIVAGPHQNLKWTAGWTHLS